MKSDDGEYRAVVDLSQEEVYRILTALADSLNSGHVDDGEDCNECSDATIELLERFIDIDEGLSVREKFRFDV